MEDIYPTEPQTANEVTAGYQARGQAWDPLRPDILELMRHARQGEAQPIYYGSNHCFLVTLRAEEAGESLAVYKPARGEYPLYDFPNGTLYRREVASWLVDSVLGWHLIPPTIATRGRYGAGSLQLFLESYPEGEVELAELQRLALLDVLLNNADRKPEHFLLGQNGKLWGIDHGLTFHVQPKLRTVLWHFAGTEIPVEDFKSLERLYASLDSDRRLEMVEARELLSPVEWRALRQRTRRLIEGRIFPDPRQKPVPYRW